MSGGDDAFEYQYSNLGSESATSDGAYHDVQLEDLKAPSEHPSTDPSKDETHNSPTDDTQYGFGTGSNYYGGNYPTYLSTMAPTDFDLDDSHYNNHYPGYNNNYDSYEAYDAYQAYLNHHDTSAPVSTEENGQRSDEMAVGDLPAVHVGSVNGDITHVMGAVMPSDHENAQPFYLYEYPDNDDAILGCRNFLWSGSWG